MEEAGNVFGSGSRTPIAITLLVKRPRVRAEKATIHYHDIGDYLNREEKLAIVRKFKSIGNPLMGWKTLQPNEQGDWISHRNDLFGTFIPIGDKNDELKQSFFVPYYTNGLKSARDAYCYNSNVFNLIETIKEFILFYENQRLKYQSAKKGKSELKMDQFLDFETTKVTWNRGLKNDLLRNKEIRFKSESVVTGLLS